jgi:Ala-tRNA(Pro) deacylase
MSGTQLQASSTVISRLDALRLSPDVVPHAPARGGMEVAESAHVPGAALAKTVVIRTGVEVHTFLCVVIPSTKHLHLGGLRQTFGDYCALATEDEITDLFPDCHHDSLPPCGQAYGIQTYVDNPLFEKDLVYAGSGMRAALLKLTAEEFRLLMQGAVKGFW